MPALVVKTKAKEPKAAQLRAEQSLSLGVPVCRPHPGLPPTTRWAPSSRRGLTGSRADSQAPPRSYRWTVRCNQIPGGPEGGREALLRTRGQAPGEETCHGDRWGT